MDRTCLFSVQERNISCLCVCYCYLFGVSYKISSRNGLAVLCYRVCAYWYIFKCSIAVFICDSFNRDLTTAVGSTAEYELDVSYVVIALSSLNSVNCTLFLLVEERSFGFFIDLYLNVLRIGDRVCVHYTLRILRYYIAAYRYIIEICDTCFVSYSRQSNLSAGVCCSAE